MNTVLRVDDSLGLWVPALALRARPERPRQNCMRTDLFDFELPRDRIALRPIHPRDAARLMVIRPSLPFQDSLVDELPDLLRPGDRLVLNDTKVIPARLNGRLLKNAESRIEATLHRRIDGSRWRAFLKPARKAAIGDVIRFGDEGKVCFLGQLDATVEQKAEGAQEINETRRRGGRIVAAGTTSLRLVESASDGDGVLRPFSGETSLFIMPGYRFRAVDMLMTNFHLPRSTLFMLVAAFAGLETMRQAYAHAIDAGYRFYSYGDA